jgi:hypothetical protein
MQQVLAAHEIPTRIVDLGAGSYLGAGSPAALQGKFTRPRSGAAPPQSSGGARVRVARVTICRFPGIVKLSSYCRH